MISHQFEPVVTVETDDDGNNPRLTMDFHDSYRESYDSDMSVSISGADQADLACEWLDNLLQSLRTAIAKEDTKELLKQLLTIEMLEDT